jgi:putative ABC transport system permease protein
MASARVPIGISADNLSRANVLAVKRDVLRVRNYRLADGEWLSSDREVVIGSELARGLFGGQSPLGETILLGNDLNPFAVVGVLEPRPKQLADFDFDRDKAVFINWSDHKLAASTALFEPRIFFRAKTPTAVAPAKEVIHRLLAKSNPDAEQLVVRNPMGDLEKAKHLTETFSLSTSVMALVAVVTACTSVAALTLIQAREMQKTLALRRACGATRGEVLTIILREVLTLIIIGAAIGLAVAQIGFQWWAKNNELPTASSWGMALVGLACSFAIAVLSAAWPAWHVARQAPAELLD